MTCANGGGYKRLPVSSVPGNAIRNDTIRATMHGVWWMH